MSCMVAVDGPRGHRPRSKMAAQGMARVSRRRAAAAPASSAGRMAARQPPAHAPARAAEGEVGHGGEALLVGAQREQQVGDAVAAGQRRVVDADAVAEHAPPARPDEQRARLPDEPAPRRPRSSTSPVCACSARASWPTRSPSSPTERASASAGARLALRAHDVGAALGVELGDDPGVGEAREARPAAPAAAPGRARRPRRRTARRGRRWSASTAAPRAVAGARASTRGRQWTAASSGSGSAATAPALSRRRSAGA